VEIPDGAELDVGAGTEASVRADGDSPIALDSGPDQDAALSCEQLESEIRFAQGQARKCPLDANTCDRAFKDACGCDVDVADPPSDDVIIWQRWIFRFNEQRCPKPKSCGSCPIVFTSVCTGDPPDRSCQP
jgi:hypothetical protein